MDIVKVLLVILAMVGAGAVIYFLYFKLLGDEANKELRGDDD